MMKKNKKEDMIKMFVKSTGVIKLVLFLFLGLMLSFSVKSQNCQIIDSVIVRHVDCHGDATGFIDIILLDSLGLTTYSFSWNNLASTEDIVNLTAATYSVQIIDDNDTTCIQDTSFTITEPQDPLSSTVNLYQDVDCFGDSTGVAYADAIGGTFPYSYLWSNGQTGQMANGLWGDPSGQGVPFTHTVTITDDNGCIINDNIDIVNSHAEIVGVVTVIQDVSCFDACDGIAELSSSGGVLQHTYFWDNGQTYIGSGPDIAPNLCYGGHSIIIEDALGCRKTIPFNISQPDELFAQAIQVQPVQCYGFDDGIAFATATGGTTPYAFVWDDPINGPTGQDIDSLTPGIHVIYVTDANGCTASDTVVITEPTQLEVIIDDTSTVYSYCAGTNSAQLCAIASGGTPNYTYLWNDDLSQTTACAYDLVAQYSDYTVIVMDDRNCIATVSFQLDSITNSMNPDSVIVDINHVSCFGIYDGSVAVSNVVGAVAPFDYTWTGPSGYTGTGSYISSLYAGSYALIISDSNNCAITINAEVLQPDQLEYTTYNVIGETCYGACDGQIWVDVNGGTGNYYYDVSEIGTFPIPAANQLQLINDSLIFDLCEGSHSIYITDDNNCEGAVVWGGNWVEYVDSGAYFSPFPGINTNDASCFNTNDGQAWIAYPFADSLFNYTWETTSGTVIDIGDSTGILAVGNYNLVVHYADSASFGQNYPGCDVIYPFTLSGPIPLVSNAIVSPESCFGFDDGSIALTPLSSASGIPTVLWDTTTSIPISNPFDFNQSPLQPGVYTVTITDSDGCQITEDYTIDEAEAITASTSFNEPSCFGLSDGTATVSASGGSAPYTYEWSDGQITQTAISIGSGIYTITVTDANLCQASFSVIVTEPEDVISSVEASIGYNGYDISCNGFSDGEATVATGGGIPPYTFSWVPSGGNGAIETGMSAGLHTVTVTDGNNCTESASITLEEPDYLDPNLVESYYSTSTDGTTNEIECYGWSNGWLESQTLGGVETADTPFTYLWIKTLDGSVVIPPTYNNKIENLSANSSYTVTITDANGCVSTATSTIFDEPDPFIANVITTNYGGPTHAPCVINFFDSTMFYTIDPYTYAWSWDDGFADANLEFSREEIGLNEIYIVLTNSATGCMDTVFFNIEIQGIPDINNVFTPNGDGKNDVFSFEEYGMSNVDVSIYNRWGQLVKAWNGTNEWEGNDMNGDALPEGVYFYVLVAEGEDGYHYEHKGSITLLR